MKKLKKMIDVTCPRFRNGVSGNVVVMAVALGIFAHVAEAQACKQWDLSGPFSLEQSNGAVVAGEFKQTGESINGSGRYYTRSLKKGEDVEVWAHTKRGPSSAIG